jgi:signal transduction histidine kinase
MTWSHPLTICLILVVLLMAGLTVIAISLLRLRNLLRTQMEFLASVSHGLRTPLAVIGSAADNLAEGVVRSEQSVCEYGSLIRGECRRLAGLVEQTLQFAAGKADYRIRNVESLRVAELIERIVSEAKVMLVAHGCTLERFISPDLPIIRADTNALSECLHNLLSNAMKYGGDSRWIGLYAHPVETGRGTGVQITIRDRGPGITAEDLPHVFEPFFRGKSAREAEISGTGLGLSLAREAANNMGARITVQSTSGAGSSFTLHIPAAYMNSSTIPVEALVES